MGGSHCGNSHGYSRATGVARAPAVGAAGLFETNTFVTRGAKSVSAKTRKRVMPTSWCLRSAAPYSELPRRVRRLECPPESGARSARAAIRAKFGRARSTKAAMMLGLEIDEPIERAVAGLVDKGVRLAGPTIRAESGSFVHVEDPAHRPGRRHEPAGRNRLPLLGSRAARAVAAQPRSVINGGLPLGWSPAVP
jgi:hypothetical protein